MNMIKFLLFWAGGMFTLKFTLFEYALSVTKNDIYLLHIAIWPMLVWTICWAVVFAIIIGEEAQK